MTTPTFPHPPPPPPPRSRRLRLPFCTVRIFPATPPLPHSTHSSLPPPAELCPALRTAALQQRRRGTLAAPRVDVTRVSRGVWESRVEIGAVLSVLPLFFQSFYPFFSSSVLLQEARGSMFPHADEAEGLIP